MGATKFSFDGQELPVFFGMKAMEELITPDFVKTAESGDLHAIKWFKEIIYVGLKEGARKEKMKFDLKKEDVESIVDNDFEVAEQIYDLFMEARGKYDHLFNRDLNGVTEKK